MQREPIVLHIDQSRPDNPVLLPLLERAPALLGAVVPALENEQARVDLVTRLEQFRVGLATPAAKSDLTGLAATCLDLCEQTLHRLHTETGDRRGDLQRLVTMIRETLAALVQDGGACSTEMVSAAQRFGSLLQIREIPRLRERLASEVSELRRIADERHQQWQRSVSLFESRITALEQQLVAVKQEASVDALTGISNRRTFEHEARQAMKERHDLVVAAFDLDDFKLVNDTGGHAAGDAVLKTVGEGLRTAVRKQDLAARMGGDEFAWLGIGLSLRDAEVRARAIMAAMALVPTGVPKPATVSLSCGLAEYCAGDTLESLMHRADQALYDAKRSGKGRLAVKSPPFIRDLLRPKR